MGDRLKGIIFFAAMTIAYSACDTMFESHVAAVLVVAGLAVMCGIARTYN